MSFNNQYFDTVDGSSNRSSSLYKWENLTIKDRFLFAKVMGQKENCLPLLQRLFPELQITDIRYVETEKTVEGSIIMLMELMHLMMNMFCCSIRL